MTGSATKQSIVTVALAVDCFALLLTMTTNINSHSRARYARGFARTVSPRENRGRRECRARNAPAASHAMKKAYEHSHHGHTGTTRHSPRNGFTAYFALSSVTTLFDTVACASYRKLDANDWGVGTTRLRRTRRHHSSSAPTASTASGPTLVTCATPLLSRPDGANQ